MDLKFSHVMLYVADFDRALKWYTEILGCEELYSAPPVYARLHHRPSGVGIALHAAEAGNPDIAHGAVPYFTTPDLDKTCADLKARGVKVDKPKREGRSYFTDFYDPDGNTLGLQEA
jgi:predicted enzyme related to lactoylglutathione lyase